MLRSLPEVDGKEPASVRHSGGLAWFTREVSGILLSTGEECLPVDPFARRRTRSAKY